MNTHTQAWQIKASTWLAAAALAMAAMPANAQDRVPVTLSDPARPVTLRVSVLTGSITVKGADTKEVIVEARARVEEDGDRDRDRKRGNLRRLPMGSSGLTVEEENNTVRVSTDSHQRAVDLTITVPRQTSVRLRSTNDGDIIVSNIEGEIDVNNTNGGVSVTNVAGSVVAHALNENVTVSLTRLNGKPMAFSSLNGDIDVTLPADLKANLTVKSDGDVFSDFDVQVAASAPQQTVEDARGKGGKYRVRIEKAVRGTINGGGPEIQFTNFNGDIFIRKAGSPR